MSKLKNHSGAKKRFKFSAGGKILRTFSRKKHNLRKRPQSMKRQARGTTVMHPSDQKILMGPLMIPFRKKIRTFAADSMVLEGPQEKVSLESRKSKGSLNAKARTTSKVKEESSKTDSSQSSKVSSKKLTNKKSSVKNP